VLKKNSYFLFPYLLFLLIGAVILISFPKADIHLFINQYHNRVSDLFFTYATFLAEGLFIAVIVGVLVYYNIRKGALVLFSFLSASLLTQFLKRMIFNDYVRPKAFFEGLAQLRFVEGVTVHSNYSFPSGHATGAFALFFALALLAKNKINKLLLFFCALLVAWSRIHLSQHFLVDIYVGSLIGVGFTLLTFWFFHVKLPEGGTFDRPLKTLLKRRNESK
jgi:membrane-associated phospholipid phosphatase